MEQNWRNGVSRYFMFFNKGRVYETMSRTGIEKTRDIEDIKRRKRNGGTKGKKIGESGRIETQLRQSTVGSTRLPGCASRESQPIFLLLKKRSPTSRLPA